MVPIESKIKTKVFDWFITITKNSEDIEDFSEKSVLYFWATLREKVKKKMVRIGVQFRINCFLNVIHMGQKVGKIGPIKMKNILGGVHNLRLQDLAFFDHLPPSVYIFCGKAELLQLNHDQFISRISFTNKKVENQKN